MSTLQISNKAVLAPEPTSSRDVLNPTFMLGHINSVLNQKLLPSSAAKLNQSLID